MEMLNQKWNKILEQVKFDGDLSDIAYETWLFQLKPYDIDEEKIYVSAPNDLTIQQIQRKFLLFMDIAVAENLGKRYILEFTTEEKVKKKPKTDTPKVPVVNGLNKKYSFETFIVGDNNRFAQASALAVAELPGEAYNPLYIHGGPGLGKTHLIQAIGQYISQQDSTKKVIYVTSEQFTNEVIEAIRMGGASDITKLREKYRTCDVLIIDDIQFLIGKESTQQEFFHTFNELHAAGKQIVITSDRPPKELKSLNERIISRCEWGLMANIDIPDFKTRMDILRKLGELHQMSVEEGVLEYIANHFTTNIRELEGALTRLAAYNRLTKEIVTLQVAERELALYISPDSKKEVSAQLIIETVAEHYQIPVEHIISKKRNANLVKPRHIAMYLCDDIIQLPLNLIGSSFGNRDHSTVCYARDKVAEEMKVNKQLVAEIETIKKKINPN